MWTAPVAKSEFRLGLRLKPQAMALFLLLSCAFLGKLLLSKYCKRASFKNHLKCKCYRQYHFSMKTKAKSWKTKKKRRNQKSYVELNKSWILKKSRHFNEQKTNWRKIELEPWIAVNRVDILPSLKSTFILGAGLVASSHSAWIPWKIPRTHAPNVEWLLEPTNPEEDCSWIMTTTIFEKNLLLTAYFNKNSFYCLSYNWFGIVWFHSHR